MIIFGGNPWFAPPRKYTLYALIFILSEWLLWVLYTCHVRIKQLLNASSPAEYLQNWHKGRRERGGGGHANGGGNGSLLAKDWQTRHSGTKTVRLPIDQDFWILENKIIFILFYFLLSKYLKLCLQTGAFLSWKRVSSPARFF